MIKMMMRTMLPNSDDDNDYDDNYRKDSHNVLSHTPSIQGL